MKINGKQVAQVLIIDLLKKDSSNIIYTLDALLKRPGCDLRLVRSKLLELKEKITKLGVEECHVTIKKIRKQARLVLIDTQRFEAGLKKWESDQKSVSRDFSNLLKKVFYEEREALDISGLRARELPPQIGWFSANLKILNLSNNHLSNLPREIRKLSNLEELNISSNQIRKFPPEIGNVRNLTAIFAEFNQIEGFPDSFSKLSKLEKLHLSSNKIREFSSALTSLANLKELYVASNLISSVSLKIEGLENLSVLDLRNNQLTTFPNALLYLPQLKKLYLDKNRIRILPETVDQFTNLEVLSLRKCSLVEVPDAISQMPKLRSLFLCSNDFYHFPTAVCSIESLVELSYRGNQKSLLPIHFMGFKNLAILDLGENDFRFVPAQLYDLKNLQKLDLSGNRLEWVSSELKDLPKLETIDLSGNSQLSSLPLAFSHMWQISDLLFSKTGIKKEIYLQIVSKAKSWSSFEDKQIRIRERQLVWQALLGKNLDWSFIDNFSENEKNTTNRWLNALELSHVFNRNQQKLMLIVCEMLEDLKMDEAFRSAFLSHREIEDYGCPLQAPSNFNILYTLWIETKKVPFLSLKDKIRGYYNASKTCAFREVLKNEISTRERKQAHKEAKRIDIELFYEVKMGEELNLVTKDINYLDLRNVERGWINEERIKILTKKNAFERLVSNKAFQDIVMSQPEVKQAIDLEHQKYQKILDGKVYSLTTHRKKKIAKKEQRLIEKKQISLWTKQYLRL